MTLDIVIVDDGEHLVVSDGKTSVAMQDRAAERFRAERAICIQPAERDAAFMRGFFFGVSFNISTKKE